MSPGFASDARHALREGVAAWRRRHVCRSLWDRLPDSSEDLLHRVHEMVIEYDRRPGLRRTLYMILGPLAPRGFEYLLPDFDVETNSATRPPFCRCPPNRYLLLVYARRIN